MYGKTFDKVLQLWYPYKVVREELRSPRISWRNAKRSIGG